jgi:hypothetical protein
MKKKSVLVIISLLYVIFENQGPSINSNKESPISFVKNKQLRSPASIKSRNDPKTAYFKFIRSNKKQLSTSHLLKYPDGHIKIQGLQRMREQAPSKKHLISLLTHIISFHDPKLIYPGLLELRKFTLKERAMADKIIMKSFYTGSYFVKEQLSKYLNLILREENIKLYQALANTFPPTSNIRLYMEAHIRHFHYSHS